MEEKHQKVSRLNLMPASRFLLARSACFFADDRAIEASKHAHLKMRRLRGMLTRLKGV
jgi:hypothetical protein